jgi:hypothetical protein
MVRSIQFPRQHKFTYEEVLGYLKRQMKRQMIADGLIVDPSKAPPKYLWNWYHEDKNGEVTANTRGEARSLIKKALGVSPNKRLPLDIIIQRRENDERSACCTCALA